MFLLETFPVPLSQNKDSKAKTNSGGLIPLMSSAYFPEADAFYSEDFCNLPPPKTQQPRGVRRVLQCCAKWDYIWTIWQPSVHLSNKEEFITFPFVHLPITIVPYVLPTPVFVAARGWHKILRRWLRTKPTEQLLQLRWGELGSRSRVLSSCCPRRKGQARRHSWLEIIMNSPVAIAWV